MKLICRAGTAVAIALFLALLSPIASAATELGAAAHPALQFNRYGEPQRLPESGVTFERDVARWTLESGSVRALEPVDGRVTGFVFEGRGRFRLAVPDAVEQRQLDRLTPDHELDAIDEPFTEMVVRTTDPALIELLALSPDGPHTVHDTAAERHENWLVHRFYDADARVLCGLGMPGDDYLRAAVKTDEFGWLTFDFDPLLPEEIGLERWDPKTSFTESWVSLDRAEHRLDDGRPSREEERLFDLEHVDLEIDLTEPWKRYSRVGYGNIQPRLGRVRATLTFTPSVSGPTTLPLVLHPWGQVDAVRTAEGTELEFVRDTIGERSSVIEDYVHDDSLVVFLDKPLEAGRRERLTVDYEIGFVSYAPGRGWYPGERDGFHDVHTARMRITTLDKQDLRAMGRPSQDETSDGKTRTAVWEVESPTRMVTFAFSNGFNEKVMEQEGQPDVVALAATDDSNEVWNVAADVVNSIQFFQQIFASPLPNERLLVTGITGNHGQAFDGFLHLGDRSIHIERKVATERFRAHEVAHQWWGHAVAWKTYRDQWLSEAFAEYSALMFVEGAMENGPKHYEDIIEAYTGDVLGKAEPTLHSPIRPMEPVTAFRERIGPIDVGYRASTGNTPGGYVLQSYVKGPLVLHMLRVMLRNLTKSDELFVSVLREFLAEYSGSEASTEDFLATLTRVAPGDWSWFFEQWVYDTHIPTYAWRHTLPKRAGADGKFLLEIEIEQRDVPEGFRMPVPVEVDFGGGRSGQVVVLVDEARETFRLPLPAKPKKVTLNPGGAVLAKMKKL